MGRYEGLYSILYYLSIMLLSTFVSKKYKKTLVFSILFCGMVQACYAICQCYELFGVKLFYYRYRYYDGAYQTTINGKQLLITGLISNPNFFATYMLLCLSYSLGLFIDSKKLIMGVVCSLFSMLFMFALLISNVTSCIVGLVFVCILIFIYCLKRKLLKKLFVIISILVAISCLTMKLEKTKLIKDVRKTSSEVTDIANGNYNNNYGTNRLYIWKETVKIIPQYFWHGVGIDSYHKAFNGTSLTLRQRNKVVIYDKAHNEYLQILITQGIFALISYIWLYGYVVISGIKKGFKSEQIYLVLPIIGYLVQAFFNISVIEVAPIFFISLGLCCGKKY